MCVFTPLVGKVLLSCQGDFLYFPLWGAGNDSIFVNLVTDA